MASSTNKKFNMDTLKNLKTSAMLFIALWIFGLIVCLGMAAALADSSAIMAGVIGLGGGAACGYMAYATAVSSKNQKTCESKLWNKTCGMKPPSKYLADGDEADFDLEITECEALKKANYGGYSGVYLVSNTSTAGSTSVDAYYIPGDVETIPLVTSASSGARFYARIGDPKTKEGRLVTTGVTSPAPPCT